MLRFLLIDKSGHALVRNAEKIYLDNTNLLYAINEQIGKETNVGVVREVFVISGLENAGYNVFYSKTGDIACEGNVFEIGGVNKKGSQIETIDKAYLIKDDILYSTLRTIPLYLFGFLG